MCARATRHHTQVAQPGLYNALGVAAQVSSFPLETIAIVLRSVCAHLCHLCPAGLCAFLRQQQGHLRPPREGSLMQAAARALAHKLLAGDQPLAQASGRMASMWLPSSVACSMSRGTVNHVGCMHPFMKQCTPTALCVH